MATPAMRACSWQAITKLLLVFVGLVTAPSSHALDGNGRAGLVWPGATPTATTNGEIALGTGFGVSLPGESGGDVGVAWLSSASLVWAPGDRAVVEAQALGGVDTFVGFLGARYVVARSERVSFGPWVGALSFTFDPDGDGWEIAPAAGLAIDYHTPRFGLDASVPVVWAQVLRDDPFVAPAAVFSELGVTWKPSDTTSMRLGLLLPFVASLQWRHELGENGFYEVDLLGGGANGVQVRAGWRF